MVDFMNKIAESIAQVLEMNVNEIEASIENPKGTDNGDYAFPCFRLAKTMRKAPPAIAEEIKSKLLVNEQYICKVEVVGGYVNFFVNKEKLANEVLREISKNIEYGKSEIGQGKNVVVDYSSPNIAKPFHIGHLRSTVIGGALYNIYKYLGYNVTGVNHLGDYGTQFGKLIEGYKLWGDEYDIESNPIDELTKIYVRINDLCKQDKFVLEACRDNFKKLEEGDPYCTQLWNKFKELSLKEFNRIYNILGVNFDSLNGEAFYSDKMDEVVDLLDKSGKLVESEGAKIIDLEEVKKGICMIRKSNDSTTYATRDLAAILYRARTYDFDKCLYVVAYEQNLHFSQVFEVAKLLGLDEKYTNGLEHVQYGMVQLKSGRMSTREGNVSRVNDLLQEAISRVENIIEEKNPDMENKKENAKKIGIGAITFSNVGTTIIKDQIFDWDAILNFNGETGPYVQYTYVRTQSVLKNVDSIPHVDNIDVKQLNNKEGIKVIKLIYNFQETIIEATNKNEPSILARYLIDLAKAYSTFYNEYKIISEVEDEKNARVYLTYMTGLILKIGMNLLGIEMPDKM